MVEKYFKVQVVKTRMEIDAIMPAAHSIFSMLKESLGANCVWAADAEEIYGRTFAAMNLEFTWEK